MILTYFSFLNALVAATFCKVVWGAHIKAMHAIFFLTLCVGCGAFGTFGYDGLSDVFFGAGITIFVAGAYMLGPLYGGMNLDVPIKKAGWIFFAMLTFFVLIIFYWAFSDFSGFWSINNIWLYSIIMAMLYLYFFFVVLQLPPDAES